MTGEMKTRSISMKIWGIVLSIIIILTIFCSPGLAVISKSDLISQYKAGQFWEPATPTPTPTVIPTTVPTQAPTGTGTGTIRVSSRPDGASVYIDGEYKGVAPDPDPSNGGMIYISQFQDGNAYNALSLTGIPAGPHQLKFTKEGYKDYSRSVTVTGGETMYVYAHLVRISPDPTPTVIPTPVPTQAPPIWSSPVVPDSSIKTKSSYVDSLSGFYPKKPVSFSGDIATFSDSTSYSGKPNIYLYSDRDLTARVRLTPEKAITVSEPAYQPGQGWLAQIRNGSLNGNGDFLFYEGTGPDSGWQKEEGYIIRASSREQDMASMLGPYGFNEKETVEFIEYWAIHLIGDKDFVFYPQETDAVERVMPLSVSPKPDHVMRIWFSAEPLVSAPELVTHQEKIVREGFYVVEWGVIIKGKYWINHSPASSEVLV